jgi:hypothetical protein
MSTDAMGPPPSYEAEPEGHQQSPGSDTEEFKLSTRDHERMKIEGVPAKRITEEIKLGKKRQKRN